MKHLVAAPLSALMMTALLPTGAEASTFDDDGRLHIDDAALAITFDAYEQLPVGFDITLYDASYNPLGGPQVAGQFESDADGLEGEGAFLFGGDTIYGSMMLVGLDEQLDGRRAELRIWQRPEGTRASLDIYFYGGDTAYAFATGDYSSLWYAGMVSFRATGRFTSDGWEEWSTGPFNVPEGGGFRPSVIQFYDQQLKPLQQSYSAGYEPDLRVRLDALEVVDLGPSLVPEASCTLASESEVCGDEGLCLYGRCADASVVTGAPPLTAMLEDYVDRRLFEISTFSGGRLPQAQMGELASVFDGLKADPAPARFWPAYRAAVDDLRDGHASAPYAGYPAQSFVGVCAHLGEANLLPEGGNAPLIFETDNNNPISTSMLVGDAVTAIDGLPPSAWAQLAARMVGHPGDPAAFDVVTAPNLLHAAAVAGSVIEISRCDGGADGLTPCDESTVERIELDTALLLGDSMWNATPPAWRAEPTSCDYRFERPVVAANNRDGDFAGYADDAQGIRSLLINAVPALYGDEGELWGLKVREALTPPPDKLILDQRLGQGGSVDAVDLLAGLLVSPADFDRMQMLPATDRAVDAALIDTLDACNASDAIGVGCGAYFPWELGETIPDDGAAQDTRLAVLIGSDVSGNDYTTKLLSYRGENTRVFGAAPTWGAFGVIWTLPAWQEELIGGSFQVHDTIFIDGQGVAGTFTTGVGVPPDVVVRQTQSDAIAGRDTVLEAARAWLAEEEAP
jgi:hypothetical protein